MVLELATKLPLACLALKQVECTGGTEGWISPAELRVPPLGYFTGAGMWVGCCVVGTAGEADFLLTWQVDEGKGEEEDDLLDIKVKSKSEDPMVMQ